jgi:ubiquinone/menaquinone biosynthesis C-methylase UbiE/protein tyrosine phosphatase (PTP) superfamily phosphohydrolase (DUF442 family)
LNAILRKGLLLALATTLCPVSQADSQPARNALGNPPPTVFESPDRDQWQRPEWVIDQLELKPPDIVADIGAGSGYFSRRLAKRLTDGGKVIAIDIDPGMLTYLRDRANVEAFTNIETRLVKPADLPLEPASVDLVFLSNTLHHISNRPEYYDHLRRSLRPGGRIVNIDFYKRDLPVGPRDLDHKLAKQTVLAEFTAAQLFVTHDLDGLPHQYMLIARFLPSIKNAILLDARTIAAGKPTVPELNEIATMGFRTVLNLQTQQEGSDAEAGIVEKLGMKYVNIPIVPNAIDSEQIRSFSETLTKTDNYPMLIHCASANRVGGLILLHDVLHQKKDLEIALKEARRTGLKPSLERLLLQRITAER